VLAQWPKATEDWIVIKERIKRHEVKDITLIRQEESAMLAHVVKSGSSLLREDHETLYHIYKERCELMLGVRDLLFRLVH